MTTTRQTTRQIVGSTARPGAMWLVLAAAAAGCLWLPAGEARAAVIVSDRFNDGARSQTVAGPGAGAGGETEIPWYQDAATLSVVADNTAPLSGSALQNAGGGAAIGVFGTGATNASLANTGDVLTLTADFRFAAAGTGNVRFGLYNDNGTTGTADSAGGTVAASNPYFQDRGYVFIVLQAGGNNNYGDETDTDGAVGSGLTIGNTAQTGTHPALGTTAHTATFTLTKVAAGVQFQGTVDGNSFGTFTDTTPFTSFSEISLVAAGGAVNFDNVSLTLVPEPASLGLLCGGAMLAAGWRRPSGRRRRA